MLANAKAISPKTKKCLKPHGTSGFRHYGAIWHCIKDGMNIDPCMGSGSLLLSCLHYSRHPKFIKFYGQELMSSTYNLARMNMFLHGIDPEIRFLETAIRWMQTGLPTK